MYAIVRNVLGAVLLLPLLSACSGGGPGSAANAQPVIPPPIAPTTDQFLTEAQSDAVVRNSASFAGNSDLLYIANAGNNSITVYAHDAAGNAVPKFVLAGPKTQLQNVGQLSENAQGDLYVANGDSLLVFAHGANGDVSPIRSLAGPLTGIHQITAMTVDRVTGKIFVSDTVDGGIGAILRFPPNATGNTAPFARSAATGVIHSLASDSTGHHLIVSASLGAENFDQQIMTFPKQFANGATLSAQYVITNYTSGAVADDPSTQTYMVIGYGGGAGSITRLAENTRGYGDNTGHQNGLQPGIVSSITSDACGWQLAVAAGPFPNSYVTHSTASFCPADAVYVYAHDARGSATPLRILSGPATKLDRPAGIYEGA